MRGFVSLGATPYAKRSRKGPEMWKLRTSDVEYRNTEIGTPVRYAKADGWDSPKPANLVGDSLNRLLESSWARSGVER